MSNQKKNTSRSKAMEIEGAKLLGRHVSREKGLLLLAATTLASLLPMVLGIRLWDGIPEIVPSGLVGTNGADDSIPRWMVAFGLPAFMCLLNLIAHVTLAANQKRMMIPKAANLLVGRWGFPMISVLFCSGLILQSAGGDLTLPFITPCVLGLILMMLGGHMWDCPRDAKLALRFSFTEHSEPVWKATHRLAGWLWIAVGLIVIAGVMVTSNSTGLTAVFILAAILAPLIYGKSREGKLE